MITVLTPSPAELAKLLPVWDREIRGAGLDPKTKPKKPKVAPVGFQSFGAINVEKLADEEVPEDTAAANGSSIAILIEVRGKRMLLGADAHPSVLLAGIRSLQPVGRLGVDVFKLPHHGSAANVTDDLLDAIDAKVFVFSTNGAIFGHPDRVAVARVLRRFKGQGVHLIFNYKTKFNRIWDSNSVRSEWGYTTEFGIGEHGVTIKLL